MLPAWCLLLCLSVCIWHVWLLVSALCYAVFIPALCRSIIRARWIIIVASYVSFMCLFIHLWLRAKIFLFNAHRVLLTYWSVVYIDQWCNYDWGSGAVMPGCSLNQPSHRIQRRTLSCVAAPDSVCTDGLYILHTVCRVAPQHRDRNVTTGYCDVTSIGGCSPPYWDEPHFSCMPIPSSAPTGADFSFFLWVQVHPLFPLPSLFLPSPFPAANCSLKSL